MGAKPEHTFQADIMTRPLSEERARAILRATRDACAESIRWTDVGNHNDSWPHFPDNLVPQGGLCPTAPRAITIRILHGLTSVNASRIRGLLRVVRGIGAISGFAYHENRPLWLWFASLWGVGAQERSAVGMPTDHRLPVIEIRLEKLSWENDNPALPGFVLDLFGVRDCPGDDLVMAEFVPILNQLRAVVDDPQLVAHPIRVALGLELADRVTDSVYVLSTVAGVLPQVRERLERHHGEASDPDMWRLTEVAVSRHKERVSVREMQALGAILEHCRVSTDVATQAFSSRRLARLRFAPVRTFLQRAMCLEGVTSHGIEVLDLCGAFIRDDSYMGSVCSALPFSRTLRALTVSVEKVRSWFWLAYAMFHPESVKGKWRALSIRSGYMRNEAVALGAYWLSPNGADLLRRAREDRWEHMGEFSMTTPGNGERRAMRRTMLVAETNAWVHVLESRTSTTATGCLFCLPKGSYVEVCESVANNIADLPDPVCIISPGGGMGYVARDGLYKLREIVTLGPPQAALSDIQMDLEHQHISMFLEILGPAVRRCHVTHGQPVANDLAVRSAQLESIIGIWFTSDMLTFPLLETLDIKSSLLDLKRTIICFQEHTPRLRSLILRLHSFYRNDVENLAILGKHLGGLSRLRILVLVVAPEIRRATLNEVQCFFDPQRRKQAMAIVGAATAACGRGLGALDEEQIRLILAFASLRLDECVVGAM